MYMPADGTALADTSSQLHPDNKITRVSKEKFQGHFNRHSFKFDHALHESGLFGIPRIVELARRVIEKNENDHFCALNMRSAALNGKFSAMPQGGRLAETVSRLGETGTWIKVSQAERYDAEYAEVLERVTSEFESLSGGALRGEITWSTMTLFLASPKISTPFHMDHESNFLFQVQGSKDVCLFPSTDRELVPDRDVERFYGGNAEAARYCPELQDRGTVYRLTPGEVVHHPPLAPHWVRNDDNISVSVAIAFCMKPLEARARVYQANYILRKIGLKPVPPGRSPLRDHLKRMAISTLENRDPKSYSELVFSPVNRFKAPLNAVRRLVRR